MNPSRFSYLNGQFLPLQEATVSVMDRGFLFGDGVYEVIPVYNGKLFRFSQHLKRLHLSLDAIALVPKIPLSELEHIAETLIQKNELFKHAFIYLQITRGVSWIRDHRFPTDATPTIFMTFFPILTPPPDSETHLGIKAITREDTRWQNCHIKAITLLPNVLLREEARQQGADETILVRAGYALEGTSSNLFIVHQNQIITPPKGTSILGGITRELVLELADAHTISYQERDIPEGELRKACEIWVTSSTKEIQPIIVLNGQPIGGGKPGPLWKKMNTLYQQFKENV